MDKPTAQMPPAPTAPTKLLPTGAVDAHFHMVAGSEYPLWEGRVEDPTPGHTLNYWMSTFREHLKVAGFSRGLVVHSILYGTDNRLTIETVKQLGDGFKGVGLLGDDATEQDLDTFVENNLVAVRLNYVHGGVLSWEGAKKMAPALAERGLHIQMLIHADAHMAQIADDIRQLPCPVVIDHLGWPKDALDPASDGVKLLCDLMADGHVYTKISAAYRMCPAPYSQVDDLVSALLAANHERCMWGSDWPHLMLNGAQMPQLGDMIDAVDRVIPSDDVRRSVFVDTPVELFGL